MFIKFPGHFDDLGRTACFLRVSYTGSPVLCIWESVDGARDPDGLQKYICLIPNEVIDTRHRRKINDELIRAGKTEVNQLMPAVAATLAPIWAMMGRR
jgi:hypothetical protein